MLTGVSERCKDQQVGKNINLDDYGHVLLQTRQLVIEAQQKFLKQANNTTIDLYWEMGKLLSQTAKKYQWGKGILARLAVDLADIFDNAKGYSEQNLRSMRQFYYEYCDHPNLFEIARNVRWGTNLSIMSKVKDNDARKFYLEMARDALCSRDSIDIQIKSQAYERECLADKNHNFNNTLPIDLAEKAENILKPGYLLEVTEPFSGSNKFLEKHVESYMVRHIKKTIMMLGKGFTFIDSQYRIEAGGNEYFIDLLFFNRVIRSLFCVELKSVKFKAEYAGKMNLYLGLLDDYVRQPDENPSIGLILCTDKNAFEADYALRDVNKPMGVAELTLSKVLPKNLAESLPDPKQLEEEILHKLDEKK